MKSWIDALGARIRATAREIGAAARMNGEVTRRQVRRVFG